MIPITRLYEMLMELQAESNIKHSDPDYQIKHLILSPIESHLIKKIGDKTGIILAVKLPDADSKIKDVDNKSEENHMLMFLLEKQDPGNVDDNKERIHYAKMQTVMSFIKDWIANRGLNGNICGGDETLSDKAFHTEWEYQTFRNLNGLSITFDLKDFSL